MRDPINAEIHKYRAEHARKFDFDLTAICNDLKKRSRNLKAVRLPAQRIDSTGKNRARPRAS